MGKRRSIQKSKPKNVFEVIDIGSEDENKIEKCRTNPIAIKSGEDVTGDAEVIDDENFDPDCDSATGVLIEVNNNSEEIDKNLAGRNINTSPSAEQQENEKENCSSENQDFCFKLLKFMKKTLKRSENFDDIIDLFKKKKLYSQCREAAKLYKTDSLRFLPFYRMEYVFSVLNKIISNGNEFIASNTQDNRYDLRDGSDPVFKAMYACLLELYFWSSPGIDKKLINDDGLELVTSILKLCMEKIIFPAFDSSYQANPGSAEVSSKKKKTGGNKSNGVGEIVLKLYCDVIEAVQLLGTVLRDQTLIDTHILRIDSFTIAAFFVNNIESLQLSLLKLAECVFSKYRHHRKALLDDILYSMEKQSGNQCGIYKLENGGKIQMHTALLMKMIQSVVYFSPAVVEQEDIDFLVIAREKIDDARKAANHFMYGLFNMCCANSNEGSCAAIVALVQDLLATVDRPEWPVAETLLQMLVIVMVVNYSSTQQKKILSLDLLTTIYSAIQRKTARHKEHLHKIDQLFENVQVTHEPGKEGRKPELDDSKKVDFLQNALLNFISQKESTEPGLVHARHFHLARWYVEKSVSQNESAKLVDKVVAEKRKDMSKKIRKTPQGKSSAKKSTVCKELSQNNSNMQMLMVKFHSKTGNNLIANHSDDEDTNLYIDADAAELITHEFELKRLLHLHFNIYLTLLLSGLKEMCLAVRLKAMRCLSHLTVVAPELLSSSNVMSAVKIAVYDQSIAIRESAIDIISKIVLNKSDMDDIHVSLLSERILDTGVSVRKKVIKTLGDLCLKLPAAQKTPEIAAKIMRRINDEPGVHNMVLEFFYKLWFLPIDPVAEPELAKQRISSIINIMHICMGTEMQSFETLLTGLMDPSKDACDKRGMKNISTEGIMEVCREIIDDLMSNMCDVSYDKSTSQRLLSVITSIFLFAKIEPNLVVRHIGTLQKSLDVSHQISNSQLIIYILRTIELAIPFIKNVDKQLLIALETNFESIIMIEERTVIQSCISCLEMFTEKLSNNFKLVALLMKKFYGQLFDYIECIGNSGCNDKTNVSNQFRRNTLKRAFCVVGLLLRHFNFCDKNVCCEIVPLSIAGDVVSVLDWFMRSKDEELKLQAVMAVGNVCVRYFKLMLAVGNAQLKGMKSHYLHFLGNPSVAYQLKIQD